MRLYKVDIRLRGAFATVPKGDTIFGQLCWQIVQNEGRETLEKLLVGYLEKPFVVISDMLIGNSVKKPPLPDSLFGIAFDPAKRKENKAKNIIILDELIANRLVYDRAFIENHTKYEKAYKVKESIVVRNSISRITSGTKRGFDPFSNYRYDFNREDATLYVLIDEEMIDAETIEKALGDIGKTGLGKDATVGNGKYEIVSFVPFSFENPDANALLTLSPSILYGQGFERAWYDVFTRFGKHGNYLAHRLVWKNPILMAESFALILSETKQYIGKGLGKDGKISKSMPQTVHQGYAITIPLKVEFDHETVYA